MLSASGASFPQFLFFFELIKNIYLQIKNNIKTSKLETFSISVWLKDADAKCSYERPES